MTDPSRRLALLYKVALFVCSSFLYTHYPPHTSTGQRVWILIHILRHRQVHSMPFRTRVVQSCFAIGSRPVSILARSRVLVKSSWGLRLFPKVLGRLLQAPVALLVCPPNAVPHADVRGPCPSLEQQDGKDDAEAETEAGFDD